MKVNVPVAGDTTFASALLKLKEPTWGFEVSVPACSLSGVAHALLARDAARFGVELEVEVEEGEPARRWTSYQLDSMEHLGEDLQLELIDPKKYFGAVCARAASSRRRFGSRARLT